MAWHGGAAGGTGYAGVRQAGHPLRGSTLTTKLGTRTYKVTDVSKVRETDRGGLADSGENMLTLYTCVRNQRDQRWCVTAAEV